jgi:hypothetical protein
MNKIKQNIYYKRLAVLKLKYLFLSLGIFVLLFVFKMILIHIIVIPGILAPVKEIVAPATIDGLRLGFNKFFTEIYLWFFFFFVVNITLGYIIWNINKFLQVLEKELPGNDREVHK